MALERAESTQTSRPPLRIISFNKADENGDRSFMRVEINPNPPQSGSSDERFDALPDRGGSAPTFRERTF